MSVNLKDAVFMVLITTTMQFPPELSLFLILCLQRHSVLCYALLRFQSLCVLTELSGTSVHATLYGEPTLLSAIASQSQVPTLGPTLETSRVTFRSHSQDIFLPNHDENHPLKQDFEAAAVIVLIILSPKRVWH